MSRELDEFYDKLTELQKEYKCGSAWGGHLARAAADLTGFSKLKNAAFYFKAGAIWGRGYSIKNVESKSSEDKKKIKLLGDVFEFIINETNSQLVYEKMLERIRGLAIDGLIKSREE